MCRTKLAVAVVACALLAGCGSFTSGLGPSPPGEPLGEHRVNVFADQDRGVICYTNKDPERYDGWAIDCSRTDGNFSDLPDVSEVGVDVVEDGAHGFVCYTFDATADLACVETGNRTAS